MQAKTQEALSPEAKRQRILNLIPQYEIRPIFVREHLKREIVLGTVGDRGGGKSGSDAVITLVDGMFAGKTAFSNMVIKCDIEIDNGTAEKYGLSKGGIAHFESQPLVKDALLNLDDRYRNAYILIEEINVEYSNARKALTNTNTDFNEVCQQLRKFKTTLLYNVIDEMFIDVQLRALTDVFIKTYDTAFDINALNAQKDTGLDFCWTIYPMTGYLVGEQQKYAVTKKPLPPVYFHFGPWRGIYNTNKNQEHGIYTMSRKDKMKAMQAEISVESDPELVKEVNAWRWLEEAAQDLKQSAKKILAPHELAQWLGRPLTQEIRSRLQSYGIFFDKRVQGYRLVDFNLERVGNHYKELELATV